MLKHQAKNKMKIIAVVIPTFNRKDLLKNLLTQLAQQEKTGVSLKIITVVDGSTDGTIEMLATDFPEVNVVKGTGQWWFTKSLNEGIKSAIESGCDFILTLNDDIKIENNFISQLFSDCLKVNEGNCIMGSLSISNENKRTITFSGIRTINKIKGTGKEWLPRDTTYNSKIHTGIKDTVELPTRGTLFPVEIYKILNGFDELFPQYGSDTDFTLRAHKKGIAVKISYNAVVYEYTRLTGNGSPKTAENFRAYFKNFLSNKYSPTYIGKNCLMIWRHLPKILFPWYFIIMFLGTSNAYFKHRNSVD